MTKLDWHHIIHLFHFLGIAFLLALPVTSLLLWMMAPPGKDIRVTTRLAELLTRLDRVAQVGALILLISGIGQIWAHGIASGDIFTHQIWLAVKLVLFVLLVLNGILFAGPALRNRVKLLRSIVSDGGQITSDQEAAMLRSYRWTQLTGSVMILFILAILFTVFYQPFTTSPR